MPSPRETQILITTWQDDVAPPQFAWHACVGDYDLDVPTGTGATRSDAILDLLWAINIDQEEEVK